MIRATPTIFNPKNKYDHKAFNTIWTANSVYDFALLNLVLSTMIRYKATPSKKYKIGQTTANTHPAGVKAGLTSALYQISDAPLGEKSIPIIPGKKDMNTAKTNNKNFFIKNSLYYCSLTSIAPTSFKPYKNDFPAIKSLMGLEIRI